MKRTSLKSWRKAAGDLRGLDAGGVLRSLLDAGLHVCGDWARVKETIARTYERGGCEDLARMARTAIITPLGVGTTD